MSNPTYPLHDNVKVAGDSNTQRNIVALQNDAHYVVAQHMPEQDVLALQIIALVLTVETNIMSSTVDVQLINLNVKYRLFASIWA